MPATKEECERMAKIALDYLSPIGFQRVMDRIWEEVGKDSNNASFRDTIAQLQLVAKAEVEKGDIRNG